MENAHCPLLHAIADFERRFRCNFSSMTVTTLLTVARSPHWGLDGHVPAATRKGALWIMFAMIGAVAMARVANYLSTSIL